MQISYIVNELRKEKSLLMKNPSVQGNRDVLRKIKGFRIEKQQILRLSLQLRQLLGLHLMSEWLTIHATMGHVYLKRMMFLSK